MIFREDKERIILSIMIMFWMKFFNKIEKNSGYRSLLYARLVVADGAGGSSA